MPVRRAPDFAELGRRLARALPSSERSTLLHGDFRLDNVVLDAQDPGKAVAVLDWEMATLGEPLVDLGMLMLYWGEPGEQPLTDVQAAMSQPGFPTRAEAVERYVDQTGIDLDDLDFYVVLAHFKMAVIAEGIYNRFVSGNTVGSNFERITEVPLLLLERGLELARASATFDPTAP
jgi:aminoglycoside phosphotransferase (APT) family kinase protein